jgi:hypothetical protein
MESFRELSEPQYHEKQRRQLCLLHALNNIFQREEFKENELNQICETYVYLPLIKTSST